MLLLALWACDGAETDATAPVLAMHEERIDIGDGGTARWDHDPTDPIVVTFMCCVPVDPDLPTSGEECRDAGFLLLDDPVSGRPVGYTVLCHDAATTADIRWVSAD